MIFHTEKISFTDIFSDPLLKKIRVGKHAATNKKAFLLNDRTLAYAYMDFLKKTDGDFNNDFQKIDEWLQKYQTHLTILIPSTFDVTTLLENGWELF